MKTFAQINRMMLDNELEHDGIKFAIIEEVRDALNEGCEKRGLTYRQADSAEYCGIAINDFEKICWLSYDTYRNDDENCTINDIVRAVVQIYENGELDGCDSWDIEDEIKRLIRNETESLWESIIGGLKND